MSQACTYHGKSSLNFFQDKRLMSVGFCSLSTHGLASCRNDNALACEEI